ncbi:MAG: histidinol dehydrogenase [Clostridiales bacterium 38-18]|nr:MAG: histidinol dehydrogenase [Clostridiales bacterium 38-18]
MKIIQTDRLNELMTELSFRRESQLDQDESTIKNILTNVRKKGDEAVKSYTLQFDGLDINCPRIPTNQLKIAYESQSDDFIDAMKTAIQNIKRFHEMQASQSYEIKDESKFMGQRVLPIRRVGLYVPGGEALYPSTLLMNVIPAQIAGVNQIAIFTPPQASEEALNSVLAAAYLLGVEEVYQIGGVQAIAVMTYGTQSIERVDKIFGPGNQYVTLAKKMVFGEVGIDMLAGPSEILVLSDETIDSEIVASDLLSQLEHDTSAMAILLTKSEANGKRVVEALKRQIESLTNPSIAEQSFEKGLFVYLYDSLDQAITIINAIGPEHLELLVENANDVFERFINAGTIFIGATTPEALGDYLAGPNHTLPTNGNSRFSSSLGVYDFQKRVNYLNYTKEALDREASQVIKFAEMEGLEAHANAIRRRNGN